MKGRIIAKRLPSCPGHDSRFTIHRHKSLAGAPWWVHYEDGSTLIPADLPHRDLVEVVNDLKRQDGQAEGGGFSINDHGQVIARMSAPPGPGHGRSIRVIGVSGGMVFRYATPIVFGTLDPTALPAEGDPWEGPLCGMTYSFTKPGNLQPPSQLPDEVFFKEEGTTVQLSTAGGITPYPPASGALAVFLQALRRCLPSGGRFRVNEHGRAFTSDTNTFIGIVPLDQWFRPLHFRS